MHKYAISVENTTADIKQQPLFSLVVQAQSRTGLHMYYNEPGVNVQTLPHRSVNVEPIVGSMDMLPCFTEICSNDQAVSISDIPLVSQLIPHC